MPRRRERFVTIVARTRLATYGHCGAVRPVQCASEATSRTFFDHLRQRAAQDARDRGVHDLLSCGGLGLEDGVVWSALGETQALDQHRGTMHAVIENDAHQIRERCGSIRGTADSGRVRGNEMLERKSLALPVWRHPSECLAFDSDSQSQVLCLAIARLEQPCGR